MDNLDKCFYWGFISLGIISLLVIPIVWLSDGTVYGKLIVTSMTSITACGCNLMSTIVKDEY